MEIESLHIVLISIHGLIRGQDLELGRDSDTGGQTKYVVELAMALAERPEVRQVDLLTRRVVDPHLSNDYAVPEEALSEKARILRFDGGPEGYIRKEEIWDCLDSLADNAVDYYHRIDQVPDLIHSHYADAGYVGQRLARVFGSPLVHTGHSLGRVKRRRLLATGMSREAVESRYNMARRINAEEDTLASAELVIASTRNEVEEQYGLYDYYLPERMKVIPPGTDLERFHPPFGDEDASRIAREINRFLRDPDKPMILALSRPDERKNIATLIQAYGESAALQQLANLVIVAGNRDDIREMESGTQKVLNDLLVLIDTYDLYGRVAYPKHHTFDEVSVIYRLAATSRGVFVNPALTEPFGLTLLEAAASGLPVVATEDGGPTDILANCHNGRLIDPLDPQDIGQALLEVLQDPDVHASLARNGLEGVEAHYSWSAHGTTYVEEIAPLVERGERAPRAPLVRRPSLYHDRAIFTDLDQNLLGDPESLLTFVEFVRRNRKCTSFGIATGRRLESALKVLKRYGIPRPDVLITSVGTEIHYAPKLVADTAWADHIDHMWNPKSIRRVLDELPGLQLQSKEYQSRFKLSYFIDPSKAPSLEEINRRLHQEEQAASTILSFGQFLDVVPMRASKGLALRYVAHRWEIPLEHTLAAGGSGADEDMMRGNTLAVVVANRHNEELSSLTDTERVYFATKPYAAGIMEAVEHYNFLGECQVPAPESEET
jgi:sucrose-phosphate synthase